MTERLIDEIRMAVRAMVLRILDDEIGNLERDGGSVVHRHTVSPGDVVLRPPDLRTTPTARDEEWLAAYGNTIEWIGRWVALRDGLLLRWEWREDAIMAALRTAESPSTIYVTRVGVGGERDDAAEPGGTATAVGIQFTRPKPTEADLEWLRRQDISYYGKWVALRDGRLVQIFSTDAAMREAVDAAMEPHTLYTTRVGSDANTVSADSNPRATACGSAEAGEDEE